MALKRDKFVISQRNTKVVISLSTRVPERIVGNPYLIGFRKGCPSSGRDLVANFSDPLMDTHLVVHSPESSLWRDNENETTSSCRRRTDGHRNRVHR
jgi:hypothetical protein